jgi:hypothetical protein
VILMSVFKAPGVLVRSLRFSARVIGLRTAGHGGERRRLIRL